MKKNITYLLLFLCSLSFGQRIINFNVSLVNGQGQNTNSQVLVRFTLTPGQACPGYEILHSADSLNYLPVYNYAGICGDKPVDESFSFLHGSPAFNQTNFYKISIPGFEVTTPRRIFVGEQAPQSSLLIYPNPVVFESFIHLRFYNYAGGIVDGFLYNQHGVKLKPISLNIKQDSADVDIAELSDGLYIIWLTDGNVLFRGKFIVKRA